MVCVTKNDETRATFCARVVRAPTTRKSKVNYSPLKREACPWRYAAEGASETCGGLTAARREMFTAAMWSASPECPQATQEKVS